MKTYHSLILIILLSFFLDRFSKQLILLFSQDFYILNYPVVQFHQNYGIVLGMPFNLNSFLWLLILILGLLAIYFKRKMIFSFLNKKGIIGLGLIIGGAAGNIFDRLFFGYVVDFINLPYLNLVINFADIEIIIGAMLIGLTILENKKYAGNTK